MNDLEASFEEKDAGFKAEIERHRQSFNDYKNSKTPDRRQLDWFKLAFGTENPSFEEVENYFNGNIEREMQNIGQIRKMYLVSVDYGFLSEDNLAFHASMNPHITFGYSNALHEECDCQITEDVRNSLLSSFEDERTRYLDEQESRYGAFYCKRSDTYYEDLAVWCDDREILFTMSHEMTVSICFNEADKKAFSEFEGETERNDKILLRLYSE
jgi:hypothetical protein